jgi:hypothetical protein
MALTSSFVAAHPSGSEQLPVRGAPLKDFLDKEKGAEYCRREWERTAVDRPGAGPKPYHVQEVTMTRNVLELQRLPEIESLGFLSEAAADCSVCSYTCCCTASSPQRPSDT